MTPRTIRSIAITLSLTISLATAPPLYASSGATSSRLLTQPWTQIQWLVSTWCETLIETARAIGEVGGDIEPNG